MSDASEKPQAVDGDENDPLFENARRWCVGAYGETIAFGFYTQTHLASISGAETFHRAAKKLGIAKPVPGNRNCIANTDRPPTESEVAEIVRMYRELTNPKPRASAEAGDDEIEDAEEFDFVREFTAFRSATIFRLQTLETKIDSLLQEWDIPIPEPPIETQAAYLYGIARNRLNLRENQNNKRVVVDALLRFHRGGADFCEIKKYFLEISSTEEFHQIMRGLHEKYGLVDSGQGTPKA